MSYMARNTNHKKMQFEHAKKIFLAHNPAYSEEAMELLFDNRRNIWFYSNQSLRLTAKGLKASLDAYERFSIPLTNVKGTVEETVYMDRYLQGPYYYYYHRSRRVVEIELFNNEDLVELAIFGGDVQAYIAFAKDNTT